MTWRCLWAASHAGLWAAPRTGCRAYEQGGCLQPDLLAQHEYPCQRGGAMSYSAMTPWACGTAAFVCCVGGAVGDVAARVPL